MSDAAIVYKPMSDAAGKIRRLVENERYRSADAFIDTAVKILLAWESDRPEDTTKIMQSMMPFTPEQDEFLKSKMKDTERRKDFGESGGEESARHAALGISDQDHRRVRQNLAKAAEHMSGWTAPEPVGAYAYDGYPLLFKMYSRFLPVRITMAVLANMLYERGGDHVELDDLRGAAYDIAAEIGGNLVESEKKDGVSRNKKISTGLPTKAADDSQAGVERRAHVQKRFKDQYVGRVRKDRAAGKEYADGAPAALGLVTIFEKNGKVAVSPTDAGRRLCMLDNPVVGGEYGSDRALGHEEAAFIRDELLPRLPLEHAFADAAIGAVKRAGPDGATTKELNRVFLREAKAYTRKHPKSGGMLGFKGLDKEMEDTRIVGWRVATMGRLAELGAVEWSVKKDGTSVFHPGKRGGGQAGRERRQ